MRSPVSGSRTWATASPARPTSPAASAGRPAPPCSPWTRSRRTCRRPRRGCTAPATTRWPRSASRAMFGHIAVVKGRGAASALGAAFAMDPAMMAVGCVPLVGGSLLHRHAEAVTVTALSLPLISLALHRSPRGRSGRWCSSPCCSRRASAVRPGRRLPDSPKVLWKRFWLDRDDAERRRRRARQASYPRTPGPSRAASTITSSISPTSSRSAATRPGSSRRSAS